MVGDAAAMENHTYADGNFDSTTFSDWLINVV